MNPRSQMGRASSVIVSNSGGISLKGRITDRGEVGDLRLTPAGLMAPVGGVLG